MPQVTVYIRKEDLPKWESVDKKSEFIHNALNDAPFVGVDTLLVPPVAKEIPIQSNGQQPFIPRPPDPITGYPCCQNEKKPCKHWQWAGNLAAWINELTGETREVV